MNQKTTQSTKKPSPWKRWRGRVRTILEDIPGERFRNEYRRRRDRREHWGMSVAMLSGAALLALVGLLLSIPPGMPGFLLWIPALGIIASRIRPVAKWMDRLEAWTRRAARRLWPF
ncbi:MAG: hypothetical protein ACLFRG_14350 [Desulfococcaceae bacterium]